MLKSTKGICKECEKIAKELGTTPQEKWIAHKKYSLCKYHNDMRKAGEKIRIKQVTKSSFKPKFKKTTGEWNMFTTIWHERKHKCNNCRADLGDEPRPIYFSHIISKGRNPKLRLDPDNIELLCAACHNLHEFGTIEDVKRMVHNPEKKEYLKKHDYLRYVRLFGDS